jgi:outer membrane protein insertion porin family
VNWSRLQRQYQVSFLDPYFLDSRWSFRFDTYSVTRSFQLDEYTRGGSIGVGRYLDPRDDVELRAEYTLEDVGLNNIDPYRLRIFGGDLFRNGLTSTTGLTLSVDKRNDRLFPTQGIYASASSALSGGFRLGDERLLSLLGGNFNFAESKVNFRLYQPVIPRSKRLILRFNCTLGHLWSTDGGIIPYIQRYRAGGIQSVRGYQWYSLGPTLRSLTTDDPVRADDKLIIGGTKTWINNLELESPIVPAAGISTVVFFDAGNAFGDVYGKGPIDPLGLRMAYGLGVRWRSPIGPLRFEYGIPIQPIEGEKRSVFDFGIGSFF